MNKQTFRKRHTNFIIVALRYVFLFLVIAGSFALAFYLLRAVFDPQQPADVVTLSVRQKILNWDAKPLRDTEQQVARGGAVQLVQLGTISRLMYREPNAARRFVLRLMNSQPQPVPYVLATLLFCVLLHQILRDIRPGVPFTPANVQRLRWLALLFAACDLYKMLATWWLRHHLAQVAPGLAPDLIPDTYFSSSLVANWLIGLMLLIIAAGYERGVELTEDAELTV
ncbi:Protein of unknown function [Hymenobacter daecheongensis DSM 21074]|uniref:DUF2975 domain-containing protein n=1 Tax=Hymenobacter daecheongensis DSM 21074 TaxID=1121955 RepID=A0A1M6I7V8_9BACT|nr:DUF2975 domain-containing protein [Hymenobacter daecheongensis]SHJ30557.1 Protein of unknown function [Hymenobacter daecheongensis DSM 21074]